MNTPKTIAEIRCNISAFFREVERQVDFLQSEIGALTEKLAEAEKVKEDKKASK